MNAASSEEVTPVTFTYASRIGFSYGLGLPGLMSKVIRFFTGASCSHTWLLYYDQDFACDMVMEAHLEWRLIPFEDFRKKNHIVAVYLPHCPVDPGLKYGGRLLGTGYDALGLVGNLVVLFGEWFKRKWKNPFRSKRSVFCSEGVARVMVSAQYPGSDSFDLDAVRPEHILRLLQTDGSKVWAPGGHS